jgi:hypothetical protein
MVLKEKTFLMLCRRKRKMRKTIFRQYDSRWGSLPYPTKGYSFAGSGCGCCACTHLIIEQDKYKNYTPKNVRPYMVAQGFATKGHGTLWDGITKTLKHYGYNPKNISKMDNVWKECNKGNRAGVILFRAGTRGGVTWTSGGHYVAFLDYKVVNGKHYFYMKDSGARKNDGWFCYETQMNGLIKQIWVVELPKATTKKKSVETIAKEVVNGKWGNGEARKKKLKAAGYNPTAVQKKVNELLR